MISPTDGERIVIGYKQVLKAEKSGICRKIYIAGDCSSQMSETVLGEAKGVPVETISSMRELGRECGIDVPASCAAIIKL